MGRIIPYIMENNKCLKPPTRNRTTMSKRIKNDCDFPTYSYMFSQPCPSCLCQARCGWKPSRHHSTSSPTAIFTFSVKDRMHNNLWFHLFWFCKMLHMWIWRRKAWKKMCIRLCTCSMVLKHSWPNKSGKEWRCFFPKRSLGHVQEIGRDLGFQQVKLRSVTQGSPFSSTWISPSLITCWMLIGLVDALQHVMCLVAC